MIAGLQKKVTFLERWLYKNLSEDENLQELLKEVNKEASTRLIFLRLMLSSILCCHSFRCEMVFASFVEFIVESFFYTQARTHRHRQTLTHTHKPSFLFSYFWLSLRIDLFNNELVLLSVFTVGFVTDP